LRGYHDGAAGGTNGVSVAQIAFTHHEEGEKVELIRGKERVIHAF